MDILVKKKPRYILLENVRNLKTHDGTKTYREIIRALSEDAHYEVDSVVLDTKDLVFAPDTPTYIYFLESVKIIFKKERRLSSVKRIS